MSLTGWAIQDQRQGRAIIVDPQSLARRDLDDADEFEQKFSRGFAMSEDRPPAVVISLHPDPTAPEAVEFFRWLGICVSTWAFIDRRLYQIFHHASGTEQIQSATEFYKDRAFKGRLRLTDRTLKLAFNTAECEAEWRPLHNEAKDLSYTRNIFAHHPAKRLGTSRNGQAIEFYSIHIEPYERILNNDYPGLHGKNELELRDLMEHNAQVENLHSRLHDFAWRVGGWRAALRSGL